LGVIGSCDSIMIGHTTIIINHEHGFWSIFTFKAAGDASGVITLFASHGLVYFIFTCILLVMDFIAIWFIILIKSPKSIASKAVKLSRSAIPGKKNKKSASSTVRERLGR
jgi:hypothetical protein